MSLCAEGLLGSESKREGEGGTGDREEGGKGEKGERGEGWEGRKGARGEAAEGGTDGGTRERN